MKKRITKIAEDMKAEYRFDYSKAVRGKYHQRLLSEGSNVVVLEPDIAAVFGSSAAVNDVLRSLIDPARKPHRIPAKLPKAAR